MAKRICSVDGCETSELARGFCQSHYDKNRRHGDPLYVVAYTRSPCSARGCERPSRKYSYCTMHAQRFVKYGTPELPERDRPLCVGPECTRTLDPIQSKSGLCRSHYAQQHRGVELKPLVVAPQNLGRPEVCEVETCDRPHKARGLCKTHNQWRIKGVPLDAEVQLRLPPGPCSVSDCDGSRFARGFCTTHYSRRIDRWRRYGITPSLAEAFYEDQSGACAICRTPMPLDAMHVDHDHGCCPGGNSCGECVRGFLCPSCNLGLGQFRDNPGHLQAAVAYLTGRPTSSDH